MAAEPTTYHKNDGTGAYKEYNPTYFPTIEELGWSRDGYTFVSWNTRTDGTGESFSGGSRDPLPTETGYGVYYAIWEVNAPTYLDMNGLAHYDSLVKIIVNGKVDTGGKAGGIPYGSVDSTSTSTIFTATVDGLTELYDGACVMLHNGVVTSAKGFTVNINGLGAKKCYNNLTNATQETTVFNVNYTLMFVYSTTLDDGNGGWWIYRGYDSDAGLVLLEYGKSKWADFKSAYDAKRIVYCLVAYGVGYRLAFMAWYQSNKVEFQYYRSVSSHTAAQQSDEVFVYTLTSGNNWTTTTRQTNVRVVAGSGLSSTCANDVLTLSASGGLPTVSSSDDGKVLTVVNGAWAASELPVYDGTVV